MGGVSGGDRGRDTRFGFRPPGVGWWGPPLVWLLEVQPREDLTVVAQYLSGVESGHRGISNLRNRTCSRLSLLPSHHRLGRADNIGRTESRPTQKECERPLL